MLGELADRFPGQVNNLCFEINIEGDKMQIDYKLHKGVCKNLNATYLMKNMGILLESPQKTG
jgi:DNA mismatch repair ATPase MutS